MNHNDEGASASNPLKTKEVRLPSAICMEALLKTLTSFLFGWKPIASMRQNSQQNLKQLLFELHVSVRVGDW